MASIPEISLEYTEEDIIINSKCFLNHYISLPLNEFLIKFHPLYNIFKDFHYCSKCLLKLFHYNKSSFFTHYCSECNTYYCIHEELKKNDKHNLIIIEKEIPQINFNFPICPKCDKKKDEPKIINGKIKQNILKEIVQNFNKKLKHLKTLENEFNNFNGKIYFELYPSFEYFMRRNYLQILLCQNLLKTYKIYKEKKKSYYQIMKNILNIFNFINDNFSLSDVKGTKEEIEEIKMHFMNFYNCFLTPKRSIMIYNNVCNEEYIKKESLHPYNNIYLNDIYKIKLTGKLIIFPEINKVFEINDKTKIYELNDFSDYEINEYVPQNISYIQNNLFIYQISDKLYINYLNKNKKLISKGIISLEEKNKKYIKIFTGKKNIFFCSGFEIINENNLNDDLNKPLVNDLNEPLLTDYSNIFIDDNPIHQKNNNKQFLCLEILRCSDNLKQAKTILTISNIDFLKKINNNLFLYSKSQSLFFLDGEGKQLKKITLPGYINEKQIFNYKENYLIISFRSLHIIWFFDLIKFKLIYSKSLETLNQTIFSKIENEDIVDENNNTLLYSIQQNLLYEDFDFYTIRYSNDIGYFFNYRKYIYFITNFENKDNIIVKKIMSSKKSINTIITSKNDNRIIVINSENVEYYKYD